MWQKIKNWVKSFWEKKKPNLKDVLFALIRNTTVSDTAVRIIMKFRKSELTDLQLWVEVREGSIIKYLDERL